MDVTQRSALSSSPLSSLLRDILKTVAWKIRVSFFNAFGLPSRTHGETKRGNSLTKIAHPEMIHWSKSDKLVI